VTVSFSRGTLLRGVSLLVLKIKLIEIIDIYINILYVTIRLRGVVLS
jgi:hypothetical protein